jgi:hypothetical protein
LLPRINSAKAKKLAQQVIACQQAIVIRRVNSAEANNSGEPHLRDNDCDWILDDDHVTPLTASSVLTESDQVYG